MIKSFQTGRSHMAIVCQTQDGAHELHERADKNFSILNRNVESDEISFDDSIDLTKEVIGIVTLENVIERILLQEIHDEQDREQAMQLLQMKKTIMFEGSKGERKSGEAQDGEIFERQKSAMDFYNHLLEDVKRSISRSNQAHKF